MSIRLTRGGSTRHKLTIPLIRNYNTYTSFTEFGAGSQEVRVASWWPD